MEIERSEQRHIGTDNAPNHLQQFAVGIVALGRCHGAVQRAEHTVELSGGLEAFGHVLLGALEEGLVDRAAGLGPGDDDGHRLPVLAGIVHGLGEAGNLGRQTRVGRRHVSGHLGAGEIAERAERGLVGGRCKTVALQHHAHEGHTFGHSSPLIDGYSAAMPANWRCTRCA